MSMIYIYSTLSSSVVYELEDGKAVTVKGGANIADKHFLTPLGVVTEVDESALQLLRKNHVFSLHLKNGHLKIDIQKQDIEKAVADMQRVDESAPDTEADAAVQEKKTGTRTRAAKAE